MSGSHQRSTKEEQEQLAAERRAMMAIGHPDTVELDEAEEAMARQVARQARKQVPSGPWQKTWDAMLNGPITFRRLMAVSEVLALRLAYHLIRLRPPGKKKGDGAHTRFRQDLRTYGKRFEAWADLVRKLGLAEHKIRPQARDTFVEFCLPGLDDDAAVEDAELAAMADGSLYIAMEKSEDEPDADLVDDDDEFDDDMEDL